jgi:hypothetical protein
MDKSLACYCCGTLWLDTHEQRHRCPFCGCRQNCEATDKERRDMNTEYWRIRFYEFIITRTVQNLPQERTYKQLTLPF